MSLSAIASQKCPTFILLHPLSTARVLQLGENPKNVFCVGGLGVDNILRMDLLSRIELEKQLEFTLLQKNVLVISPGHLGRRGCGF